MKGRTVPAVAANLKKARGDLTLQEVGERLHSLCPEVSPQTWLSQVWRWEHEKRCPSAWHIKLFAAAMGIDAGHLFDAEFSSESEETAARFISRAVQVLEDRYEEFSETLQDLTRIRDALYASGNSGEEG